MNRTFALPHLDPRFEVVNITLIAAPIHSPKNRPAHDELPTPKLRLSSDAVILVPGCAASPVSQSEVDAQNEATHINSVMDAVVDGISGTLQTLQTRGHPDIDISDVCSVLLQPGIALATMGMGSGSDRAEEAAAEAMDRLAQHGVPISQATGVLIIISASQKTLRFNDSGVAFNTVRAQCGADCALTYGTRFEDNLAEDLRVTMVAIVSPSVCLPKAPESRSGW